MSDEGFLSRWAKRKAQAKEGVLAEPPAAPGHPHPDPLPLAPAQETKGGPESVAPAPPPPTMDDVAELTPSSDFSRFVAPDVEESVKQAAMKKLFSDPHFNLMDGLDTYIEDYGKPDPIPESMLRRMVQSAALGLFADEEKEETGPKASPDGAAAVAVSKSVPATDVVPADEDPDLRLQQDDAAGPGGAGPGPGA
jgi:hypothetical protein